MSGRLAGYLVIGAAALLILLDSGNVAVTNKPLAKGQQVGPQLGPRGATGANGATGPTGPTGPSGTNAVGTPNTRTLALATAYQATDITKPAIVTVNLSSTASISLSGGGTNTASIVIGSTNAVASGTGTTICSYANSNTGTLTIGLGLNTIQAGPCSFALPTGWFWAVRQTAGTVTITSSFDQSLG